MNNLERQIYLINSLSGLQIIDAQIAPGQMVGSSDFTLTIEPSKKFDGYVTVDNYGNKFTGDERASIGGTLNSPLGYGDALSIYLLNSFTNELKYGNLSYTLPISNSGMSANLGISKLKYTLGDSYKSLDAYGDATVLEAGVIYPIIKNSTNTLDIKGQYAHRVMSDWMSGEDDKKSIDDFTLSLQSYKSMSLFELSSSLSSTLSFTHGYKSLKSQTAKINDSIAKTAGSFSKINLNLIHNLQLNQITALRTIFNTQTGFNRNLDSSQDLSVGGAYGLRAYGDNELSGDKGYLFSVELLHTLPTYIGISHQVGIFYDTAKIWSNINTWDGLEDNTRRLNDVGISYTFSYKDINLKATYAHGFGSEATPVSGVSRDKLLAQLFMVF
jgi:hemolysin activation/secretion protein